MPQHPPAPPPSSPQTLSPYAYRRACWAGVAVALAGAVVTGVGACVPSVPLVVAGASVLVLACLALLACGAMEDVDDEAVPDLWPLGPRAGSRPLPLPPGPVAPQQRRAPAQEGARGVTPRSAAPAAAPAGPAACAR